MPRREQPEVKKSGEDWSVRIREDGLGAKVSAVKGLAKNSIVLKIEGEDGKISCAVVSRSKFWDWADITMQLSEK